MKMFQVHDDNHSAYLTLAENAEEALKKVFAKHQDEGLLNEGEEELEGWLDSGWQADELDDIAQLDSDGPVCFY